MRRLIFLVSMLAFMGGAAWAGDVEFVSTGQGDKPAGGTHDAPDVGDPYAGKTVTERDDAGHGLTQQSYENCTTDACRRAEKRWGSEGTTYKDDVNQGLRKPYGTEGAGTSSGGGSTAGSTGATGSTGSSTSNTPAP